MYVIVTDWNPHESFAFEEMWRPSEGKYLDDINAKHGKDKTEFFLADHPEGVRVEIIRREKGHIQLWRRVLTGGFNNVTAGRLQWIITGSWWKKGETTRGKYHIKTDNTLKNDF